jgi:hypothetical protein
MQFRRVVILRCLLEAVILSTNRSTNREGGGDESTLYESTINHQAAGSELTEWVKLMERVKLMT